MRIVRTSNSLLINSLSIFNSDIRVLVGDGWLIVSDGLVAYGFPDVGGVVNAWGEERTKYDFFRPGFSTVVGHVRITFLPPSTQDSLGFMLTKKVHGNGLERHHRNWLWTNSLLSVNPNFPKTE